MREVDHHGVPVPVILAGILLAGGIAWFGWVLLNAPRIWEERAAALRADIAAEDTEACGRLGLGRDRGAQVFDACARELDAVRRRQDARLESPLP